MVYSLLRTGTYVKRNPLVHADLLSLSKMRADLHGVIPVYCCCQCILLLCRPSYIQGRGGRVEGQGKAYHAASDAMKMSLLKSSTMTIIATINYATSILKKKTLYEYKIHSSSRKNHYLVQSVYDSLLVGRSRLRVLYMRRAVRRQSCVNSTVSYLSGSVLVLMVLVR